MGRHDSGGRAGGHAGRGSQSGAISGDLVDPPTQLLTPVSAGGPPDRGRAIVRGVGEVLITLGLIVLLFVAYEVYITDLFSAGKQRDAVSNLDDTWRDEPADPQRVDHFDGLAEGEGFAKLYIPAFGSDYSFAVLEGTSAATLEIGPGHYRDTAYPGEPGNFAVAGHRVGKGSPFNDLDLLSSCDAIVVETRNSWFTYRVLPMDDERAGWAAGPGTRATCGAVTPLGGAYEDVVGREIVRPTEGSVVLPVPRRPDLRPSAGERASLLTLTTCHPKFSDRQRMIVHAVLVEQAAKDPAQPNLRPTAMEES